MGSCVAVLAKRKEAIGYQREKTCSFESKKAPLKKRRPLWKTIRTTQKETEMTVFLTAHYTEEAARVDYVIVIDDEKSRCKRYAVPIQDSNARSTSHIDKKFKKALTILFSSI